MIKLWHTNCLILNNNLKVLMIKLVISIGILLLLFNPNNSYCQSGITLLKGTVIDASDNMPLENAVVRLSSENDSTKKFGIITNASGEFEFRNIPFSKYKISISFIGYAEYSVEIKINQNFPQADLGKIILSASQDSTATIEVNAERYYVENKENMKVYNVEKNIISESGTASDVLKNIPSVTVDSDGKVSLRGNSNVVFLINGNQSGILTSDPGSSLDLIPSSMIQSIEIINNPSAKYEAEGITGIVNIVLKKNLETNKPANSFGLAVSMGTMDKYNLSVNANIKQKLFSLSASYNFRLFNMSANGNTITENLLNDTLRNLYQTNDVKNRLTSHTGNIGFDYYASREDVLSLTAAYNNRTRTRDENTFYRNYDENKLPVLFYKRDNSFDISGYGLDLASTYAKTFTKNHFLNISAQYSYSDDKVELGMKQTIYNTDNTPKDSLPYLERDFTKSKLQIMNFQVDYSRPLSENIKLETGFKTMYRKNDSYFNIYNFEYTSNNWIENISFKNDFVYKEYINSVYGILNNKYKLFSYQLGLRLEHTSTNANQINFVFVNEKNYLDMFPSLFMKQLLSGNSEITFGYSRRINRPGTSMLNPFVNNADPQVLRYGNPDLNPEYINSFELGYNYYFPVVTVSSSVFFRNINDVMTRYIFADSNGTSYFTYKNLDKSNTYGAEIVLNGNIFKWWYFNSNLTYLKVLFSSNYGNDNTYDSWVGKINSSFSLPANFEIQMLFSYQGKTAAAMGIGDQTYFSGGSRISVAQGLGEPDYYLDIAVKKDLFNKKLSIVFKVIDILNTSKYKSLISDNTFSTEYYRKRNTRAAFLTFSYRFGSDGKQTNGKRKLLEEHNDE